MTAVFYRPAFQMFGELFLEDLDIASECIGENAFTACGDSLHQAAFVMTAVYAFITSVVLVNLLIAMMSKTYERVESEACV